MVQTPGQIHTELRHLHVPLFSDECSASLQCDCHSEEESCQVSLGSLVEEFRGIGGIDFTVSRRLWAH